MKSLICLILASLVSLSAVFSQADDHSAGPLFYGHSIGIIASDAPAVLAAMDKWRNSKTGKSIPNTVVLLQNIVNGDYKSTHGLNIFYRNGAAMDASRELVEGDKDWAEFQKTLNSLVEFEWENTYSIVRAKVKEGDVSSANRVSMHIVFTLTDPAGFMTAFDKLWNSSDDELVALATRELEAIGLIEPGRVEAGYVVRVPKAYPFYDERYKANVQRLREWLDDCTTNVHPVGRNGMHRYNNQDHSMYTAMLTVENIVNGTTYDVWEVNVEEEYHEEKAPASGSGGSGTGRDAPVIERDAYDAGHPVHQPPS